MSGYMLPSHRAVLDQRGIENIYEHILDDNVFYATSAKPGNVKTILAYVREHYYPEASLRRIFESGKLAVYHFYDTAADEAEGIESRSRIILNIKREQEQE